jgi:hypothetical protein
VFVENSKRDGGGELQAPVALPPEKEHPVPTAQEPEWTPQPVWTFWRTSEISFSLPDIEQQFLDRPARTAAIIPITFFCILLQEVGAQIKEDEVGGSSVFQSSGELRKDI